MVAAAWEDQFATWAKSPSQTESEKIQHAITAVRDAFDGDERLKAITKVFVQGSYRNRVNVRLDSDVDIGVLYTGNAFFSKYPAGKTASDFGLIDGDYSYETFKDDIEKALVKHFGADHVTRGPKAFDIHENTYRVDADVVPLMVHRRYKEDGSFICGTELRPDGGGRIINWPERLYDNANWPIQHYEEGNLKNERTKRSYRGAVRIFKKLRNRMDEKGIAAAKPIKGFLVECLVWNVPDSRFANTTWHGVVEAVLAYLEVYVTDASLCGDWTEVSGFKWLFKNEEVKRAQAAAFVLAARRFLGP